MKRVAMGIIILTLLASFGCKTGNKTADKAAEAPPLYPVTVEVLDGTGSPVTAGITVYPVGSKKNVWDGMTGDYLELPAGEYDFRVKYNGGTATYTKRKVNEKATEFSFKLKTGAAVVRCYGSGGEEIGGEVLFFPPHYTGKIPSFKTGTGEEIPLICGEYDITVLVQDTTLPRRTVVIEENVVSEENFILQTGYILVTLVDPAGKAVPGEVRVYPAGDYNSSVASGMTGTKIPLRPGAYDIVATAEGYSERSAGISVVSNQLSEERLVTYLFEEGPNE